ncbi:homeobox domain-containing protein, partial [Phlyctochytrium arcticum]
MHFINATVESVKEQIIREETTPKKKRVRTTATQLAILQQAFMADPMPSAAVRASVAERLGMTSRSVQVWFQNKRAKLK